MFITYYWPPAGGATINRIFKFSQYLPEFGWEPVILTTKNGDFPFVDESLLEEVNPDTKIYRSAGFSLHKIFSKISPKSKKNFVPYGFTDKSKNSFMDNLSRWVKYNFIPDTRFPWYFGTARKAINIIRKEKIDLIFSSSPPQTNHIIARKASRKTGIPWVADFRDPWTDVFWLLGDTKRMKWINNWDKRIERNTISKMSSVITVGPALVEILQRKTLKPINLITNGYDSRYFENIKYVRSDKFRILYAGSLSSEQNPSCFFKSLTIAMKNNEFANDMEMLWLGNFPTYLRDIINDLDYKDKIKFSPYTHYKKSIEIISNSDLLLMIVPKTNDNACILTSKIFEYIGARRPVIAYGPVDGDADKIIQQVNIGKLFDYEDVVGGAEFLTEKWRKWKNYDEFVLCQSVDKYNRKHLTGQLAEIFNLTIKN